MLEGKVTGFQDILGNDMVKEHFKKAIENHKISHAYILTGEAGMGRKSIANAFARRRFFPRSSPGASS